MMEVKVLKAKIRIAPKTYTPKKILLLKNSNQVSQVQNEAVNQKNADQNVSQTNTNQIVNRTESSNNGKSIKRGKLEEINNTNLEQQPSCKSSSVQTQSTNDKHSSPLASDIFSKQVFSELDSNSSHSNQTQQTKVIPIRISFEKNNNVFSYIINAEKNGDKYIFQKNGKIYEIQSHDKVTVTEVHEDQLQN